MTDNIVLAIDPGLVTGVALMIPGEEVIVEEMEFLKTGLTIERFCRGYQGLDDVNATVVIEDFIITQRTAQLSQAPWSREIIGLARYFSLTYLGKEPVIQKPAKAKAFSSDAKLKALGWWVPSKGGHGNDALRHLLVYCAQNALIDVSGLAGVS